MSNHDSYSDSGMDHGSAKPQRIRRILDNAFALGPFAAQQAGASDGGIVADAFLARTGQRSWQTSSPVIGQTILPGQSERPGSTVAHRSRQIVSPVRGQVIFPGQSVRSACPLADTIPVSAAMATAAPEKMARVLKVFIGGISFFLSSV